MQHLLALEMSEDKKCPACGYVYESGDKRALIRQLKFSREKHTRLALDSAIKEISRCVPSDNKTYKEYAFLYGMQNIKDEVVSWAVRIFLKKQEYKQGKGYAYLRTMIHNAAEDFKVKKAAELRKLGKTPKSIKNKRKELGYANRNTISS